MEGRNARIGEPKLAATGRPDQRHHAVHRPRGRTRGPIEELQGDFGQWLGAVRPGNQGRDPRSQTIDSGLPRPSRLPARLLEFKGADPDDLAGLEPAEFAQLPVAERTRATVQVDPEAPASMTWR